MMATEFIHPDWPASTNVGAFMTTRCLVGESRPPFDTFNLGLHCGDDPQAVQANRRRLQQRAMLPAAPHWLAQVHGVAVHQVMHRCAASEPPQADASVTRVRGAVLAVLTADCLPVLLCARDGSEVGAAHAGWRGLAAGVLEATVATMRTAPDQLMAWLGAAAGPELYEIGDEVRMAFVQHEPATAVCFRPTRSGHWHIDLYALARRRLAAMGVTAIYGGGLCTIADARRFYSYRRDGQTGRMATLVYLKS